MRWFTLLGLAMPSLVHSFASTDYLQDTDAPQSGYLPNHNMDPAVVGSTKFAVSWKNTYNSLEVFYAKPLVFTPPGAANEQVIVVSNQNIVRVIDGLTGALIVSRTLDPPFQSADTNCGDIPNTVGITGTPIIDPATNIMYFFSKGYKGGATGSGTINGQYKFYAVNLPSLTDVSGFPVIIDGHFANNDPTRYFVGGTVLNRPGLAMIGNTIVGGFGGHCDNFNYTGMLVAVSKTSGVGVTNIQAMEASPGAPSPQTLDITVQGGGKAGIWHSGMGLAADTTNNRVFFVTGNARGAGQNKGAAGTPASGKTYLSTLEQCAVDFSVNPNSGALTQADYFEPYEYDSLNGGDRDFGSSGIALLDPATFSGGGVNRVAVAGGKSGKVYILNADNLGGFAEGTGGSDSVLQTITNANALLSGIGSYPLEGGFIYMNPTGDNVYAYKLTFNGAGVPQFTLAGKSASTFAGKSVPTVTSLNGQAGSGIVWLADTNQGLVAFHAVPVGGVLQQITPLPSTGGTTKYQRVAFGNARAYLGVHGSVVAVAGGAPATPALTCTPNPVAFGSVTVGSTSPVSVTCTAGTAITMKYCTSNLDIWTCQNSSLPTTVASGAKFTFPVTMDLTPAAIEYARVNQGTQVVPGNVASLLNLFYTVGTGPVTEYSIPVNGKVVASTGYLVSNFQTVDFGGIVLSSKTLTSSKTLILTNDGSSALSFTGFAWQDPLAAPMPYTNVTVGTTSKIGTYYTATGFPAVGSTLAAGASITISMTFAPLTSGSTSSLLTFWSDGGYTDVLLTGTASGVLVSTTSSTQLTTSSTQLTTSSTQLTTSSSVGPSTNSATTTSSVPTTLQTTTSQSATATQSTSGYSMVGCFSDISVGHALPLLFQNNSVTPELCQAYVLSLASKPTPTVLPYFAVEFHRECYGGTAFTYGSSVISSLTGKHACTDVCSGSIGAVSTGTAMCGGAKQFNLYATGGTVSFPSLPITVSV